MGKDKINQNAYVLKAFFKQMVLEGGIEPPRPQWPLDPKSSASTNSATRAGVVWCDAVLVEIPKDAKKSLLNFQPLA